MQIQSQAMVSPATPGVTGGVRTITMEVCVSEPRIFIRRLAAKLLGWQKNKYQKNKRYSKWLPALREQIKPKYIIISQTLILMSMQAKEYKAQRARILNANPADSERETFPTKKLLLLDWFWTLSFFFVLWTSCKKLHRMMTDCLKMDVCRYDTFKW